MTALNPENVDLSEVVRALEAALGPSVEGAVVGRTRLRDEVVRRLGCSELEAERVVDTMVGRGFLWLAPTSDGVAWHIGPRRL